MKVESTIPLSSKKLNRHLCLQYPGFYRAILKGKSKCLWVSKEKPFVVVSQTHLSEKMSLKNRVNSLSLRVKQSKIGPLGEKNLEDGRDLSSNATRFLSPIPKEVPGWISDSEGAASSGVGETIILKSDIWPSSLEEPPRFFHHVRRLIDIFSFDCHHSVNLSPC